MKRIYRRRERFATASPCLAAIVGYGSEFIYTNGFLCYLDTNSIHIRDIHGIDGGAEPLPLEVIADKVGDSDPATIWTKLSLLYYNAGYLLVRYYTPIDGHLGNRLVIFDFHNRRIKTFFSTDDPKSFARNTSSHVIDGIYMRSNDNWYIRDYPLDSDKVNDARDYAVVTDIGSDIGSTVAFEIHNGYFYGVSIRNSPEEAGRHTTSFYTCFRFPLGYVGAFENCQIHRGDGPINNSWTNLTLQVDECTNELMIVEARYEGHSGRSLQQRTFYKQQITFPIPTDPVGEAGSLSDSATTATSSTLAVSISPSPARSRSVDDYHPEHGYVDDSAKLSALAQTKFCAYNLSCSAFLDLVDQSGYDSGTTSLHIRVGSRHPVPVNLVTKSSEQAGEAQQAVPNPGSRPQTTEVEKAPQNRFRYEPIRFWPPSNTDSIHAQQIQEILNPRTACSYDSSRQVIGTVAVDQRSLVYMVRAEHPRDKDELGAIVLISFDEAVPPIETAALMHRSITCGELTG